MDHLPRWYLHFLMASNLSNWIRLLKINKFRFRLSSLHRVVLITLVNVATFPLALAERAFVSWRLRHTQIDHSPVFIVGFWRSGTSFLEGILAKDPHFATINKTEQLFPSYFLLHYPFIRWISRLVFPRHRLSLTHNKTVDLEAPREEEFAIANLSPFSYYHILTFPDNYAYYTQLALFRDLPPETVRQWKSTYRYLAKKIAFKNPGRRLLLKSPTNTCRMKELLGMFPNARFVHIYRNPYDVIPSFYEIYQNMWAHFSLQSKLTDYDPDDFQDFLMNFYKDFYHQYEQQKESIPAERLVEISYEALMEDPLSITRSIYESLKLPGFSELQDQFETYLKSEKDYQPSQRKLDEKTRQKIGRYASDMLSHWGYGNY